MIIIIIMIMILEGNYDNKILKSYGILTEFHTQSLSQYDTEYDTESVTEYPVRFKYHNNFPSVYSIKSFLLSRFILGLVLDTYV